MESRSQVMGEESLVPRDPGGSFVIRSFLCEAGNLAMKYRYQYALALGPIRWGKGQADQEATTVVESKHDSNAQVLQMDSETAKQQKQKGKMWLLRLGQEVQW